MCGSRFSPRAGSEGGNQEITCPWFAKKGCLVVWLLDVGEKTEGPEEGKKLLTSDRLILLGWGRTGGRFTAAPILLCCPSGHRLMEPGDMQSSPGFINHGHGQHSLLTNSVMDSLESWSKTLAFGYNGHKAYITAT